MRSASVTLAIAASSMLACASQPLSRARSFPEGAAELLEHAPAVYAPPETSLEAFAGDPSAHETVQEAARAAGIAAVRDASLDCVASVVMEVVAESRRRPAPWLERWIRWRCGAVDEIGGVSSWVHGGKRGGSQALGALSRGVRPALARPGTVYGATYQQRGQLHVAVLVTAQQLVALQPVPKRVEPGATVTLSGRLGPSVTAPELRVDEAAGATRRVEPATSPAGSCAFRWTVPRVPGKYYAEIQVTNGDERPAAIWFPIFVGVEESRAPDPPAEPVVPPGDIQTALHALLDQRRRAAGLAPLATEPLLERIAQQRTAIRASAQRVDPLKNVLEAWGVAGTGWHASSILAERATDAFTLGLAHPRTRAFLLDPATQYVGIGATPRQEQTEGQVPEMHVTWILAKPKPAEAPSP